MKKNVNVSQISTFHKNIGLSVVIVTNDYLRFYDGFSCCIPRPESQTK